MMLRGAGSSGRAMARAVLAIVITMVTVVAGVLPLALAARAAHAQTEAGLLQAAGSLPSIRAGGAATLGAAPGGEQTHGWFIEPVPPPKPAPGAKADPNAAEAAARSPLATRAVVMHVPPREQGVALGTLRLAADLQRIPIGIAAAESRLYMVFQDPPPPPAFSAMKPAPRRVSSLTAARLSVGRWTTRPVGRLDVHPGLPGEGTFVAIAASDAGVFALMLTDAGVPELLRMGQDTWEAKPMPTWSAAATARTVPPTAQDFRLFAVPGGVGVARLDDVRPAEIALWSGAEWKLLEVMPTDPRPDVIFVVNQTLATVTRPPGGPLVVRARSLRTSADPEGDTSADSGAWRELAKLDSVDEVWGVAPLASSSALAIMWKPTASPDETRAASEPVRRMIAEVSLGTGRVLFEGEGASGSPVSSRDAWMLGLAVAMVTGMVVVTVLRPPSAPAVIPKDTSMAPPLRRFLAGVVDLGTALIAVSVVTGEGGWSELSWWITPEGQWAMFMTLPLLAIVCGVLEGLTGRTLGKLTVGIRVASVRVDPANVEREPQAPGLGRGLLRNVIKWCLPPVGLMALFDPEGRHRADQLSSTAVVLPDEPEDMTDDAGE